MELRLGYVGFGWFGSMVSGTYDYKYMANFIGERKMTYSNPQLLESLWYLPLQRTEEAISTMNKRILHCQW